MAAVAWDRGPGVDDQLLQVGKARRLLPMRGSCRGWRGGGVEWRVRVLAKGSRLEFALPPVPRRGSRVANGQRDDALLPQRPRGLGSCQRGWVVPGVVAEASRPVN